MHISSSRPPDWQKRWQKRSTKIKPLGGESFSELRRPSICLDWPAPVVHRTSPPLSHASHLTSSFTHSTSRAHISSALRLARRQTPVFRQFSRPFASPFRLSGQSRNDLSQDQQGSTTIALAPGEDRMGDRISDRSGILHSSYSSYSGIPHD